MLRKGLAPVGRALTRAKSGAPDGQSFWSALEGGKKGLKRVADEPLIGYHARILM